MNPSFFVSQLLYQGPSLLVYLAAFMVGLALFRRAVSAAVLALLGSGLLIATAFVTIGVRTYLVDGLRNGRGDSQMLERFLEAINLTAGFIEATGLALLVAAIYAGRAPARRREF